MIVKLNKEEINILKKEAEVLFDTDRLKKIPNEIEANKDISHKDLLLFGRTMTDIVEILYYKENKCERSSKLADVISKILAQIRAHIMNLGG